MLARDAAGDRPGVVLGAVLPDLAPMAGVRFGDGLPDDVAEGRRLHHAADERFHDHPVFRAGTARLRARLRNDGIEGGAARGAAHVAFELLLDGCLDWGADMATTFAGSLEVGRALAPDTGDEVRWRRLLDRFGALGRPAVFDADDGELAARVEAVLGRRPRLALRAGEVGAVRAALAAERGSVTADGPALLAEVAAALQSRGPGKPAASVRTSRAVSSVGRALA